MVKCWAARIYCIYLPPHTSHVLQPLDVAVFDSPLKSAYRQACHQMSIIDDAAPADKQRFIDCYTAARRIAFTSQNIRPAFRATGIYPSDRSKALCSSFTTMSQQPSNRPVTPPPTNLDIDHTTIQRTPTTRLQVERRIDPQLLAPSSRSALRRVGNRLDRQHVKIFDL